LSRHDHVCLRQILGVGMGLAGLEAIGLEAPIPHNVALVFIETDGCFADGIEVATGALVGHRTLKIVDTGKMESISPFQEQSDPIGSIANRLGELPKDKDIFVICLSGHRSQSAVAILPQAGFANVTYVSGCLQAWIAAGYPVQSGTL
jgi:formylmethanofuran dehydrogenase subunit E